MTTTQSGLGRSLYSLQLPVLHHVAETAARQPGHAGLPAYKERGKIGNSTVGLREYRSIVMYMQNPESDSLALADIHVLNIQISYTYSVLQICRLDMHVSILVLK